jgi:hypothetical protein
MRSQVPSMMEAGVDVCSSNFALVLILPNTRRSEKVKRRKGKRARASKEGRAVSSSRPCAGATVAGASSARDGAHSVQLLS